MVNIRARLYHLASTPTMLNPNQDTSVDDIFDNIRSTSLIDTPVTAILEPILHCTNRSPSTTKISRHSKLTTTNSETATTTTPRYKIFLTLLRSLSSIPGTVDQYLANKMQEAVDVAVQLKYDRIREESNTENQQFL
ncbi:hypothetical protein Tco_0040129 [Tanacetum coccineum]